MLLPSDVARLVLGYLQEEGLSATSRAFIYESPNLREYAEHSTEDGTIPACVFSIFGKGLTTILNEYVAVKTKESNHQVPAMMTSLWKKLDFTLNQIKSLQNSPAISSCQRVCTRVGLANMARQRALTAPATGVVCSTVSETVSIISPAQTSHCMLTHSTPVSYSSQHIRLTPSNMPLLNTPRESAVNAVEQRLNPGLVSPGRRKWKRSGALAGSSSTSRPAATSNLTPEPEEESGEIVDENFPQLVIQNARDKILGDRSLQEKLAENINKILASEPTPQPTKASTNVVEPDQSIDEILGLQGEIHMSDDAIHDILEQTESDPAFQALFELFDCNKTRSSDGEPADGDISNSPEESELPEPSSVASHNVDSGTTQKEADPVTVKAKAGLERKTRKSAPLLKKTIIGPSNRTSRLENCSAKLLVMHRSQEQCQTTSSTKRKEKSQIVNTVTPMDIDEPQATALSTTTNISTMNVATTSVATYSTISSSQVAIAPVASEAAKFANVNKQQNKRTQRFQPTPTPSSNVNRKDSPSNVHYIQSNAALSITAGQFSNCAKDTRHLSSPVTSETSKTTSASSTILSAMPPPTNSVTPTTSASPVSVTYSATEATSSPSPILPSSVTVSTVESNASNKVADGNIVSLKIIISDNQEEQSSTDTALNQAISSISGDKIPTIYLSSPAKSPVAPGTPKGNLDEAAQAVSCLQRSESVIASPLMGTSQAQPSYIIQLPFDGNTPSPASYFLVTEPPTTDAQARQTILPAATVSKGQPIAPSQFGVTSQAQAFPAGSALILPSPIKPMVLPYSVMGQNTLGNMQMGPNQIVAIPNPSVVQHPETGTAKPQTTGAAEQNLIDKVVPSLTPNPVIPNTAASPSSGHRRILCFDSSGESQSTNATTSPGASTTPSKTHQPPSRTKPAILGGNKPKRRIETVRCSEGDKSTASQPTPKETAKKASRKQEHSIYKDSSSANSDNSKPLETRQRSKSTDRKHNHDVDNSNKVKASDSHLSRSVSLDSSQKSGSKKDKEATDKAKTREGRTEKRTQETTLVTANKENELNGSIQELASSSTSATVQSTTHPKTSKTPSKTSSLAKQAAEMLQDIQALRSPSTPKCTDHNSQEESSGDCPKTPSQQSRSKDGESTPRHLMPPNASDVPSCSPASEAGSENSINMAAHTLMILSRAAMARTGTPLKNSLRQEGVGDQSPTSSKATKKRKQPSPTSSPPAKKESKRTPSKKKERKKLIDCFPHDLDVDKFLSSLHYDE